MMTGDAADMAGRLRRMLPDRWFADDAPVLDALLAGFADGWAALYRQLAHVRLQARLATVSGPFMDLAAGDFRGERLLRRLGENDAGLRRRLLPIFRDKATRPALIDRLLDLTGNTPRVFEPMRPADTGGYGVAAGYGLAGGYGSLVTPFQAFVDLVRPVGSGIPGVAGYGGSIGGYGTGGIEYATADMATPHVTDQDIFDAVADVLPVGVTAWVRLGGTTIDPPDSAAIIGTAPLDDFLPDLNVLA